MAILYNASERASEAAAALLRILAVSCVLPDKMLWGFIFTTENCDVRVVVPIALEIMPSTAALYKLLSFEKRKVA